jgi:hypothetical protein
MEAIMPPGDRCFFDVRRSSGLSRCRLEREESGGGVAENYPRWLSSDP